MTFVMNFNHVLNPGLFVCLREKLSEYLGIKTKSLNAINLRKKELKT